jgi:hypothetical protein
LNKPALGLFAAGLVLLTGCPVGDEAPQTPPLEETGDTAEETLPGTPDVRVHRECPALAMLEQPQAPLTTSG